MNLHALTAPEQVVQQLFDNTFISVGKEQKGPGRPRRDSSDNSSKLKAPEAGGYWARESRNYILSIATFLFAGGKGRPQCTLANVAAVVAYPDFRQVLGVLSQEQAAKFYAANMLAALATGAEKQIAGIIACLLVGLAQIDPGPEAKKAVYSFLNEAK